MRPKKVLIITSGYPNDWKPSSGIFIKRQIDFLAVTGDYTFDVLTTGDSRKGLYSMLKYAKLAIRVLFYCATHDDFDVIHAHEVFPAGVLALMPKILRKKKLLITLHGGPLHSIDAANFIVKKSILLPLLYADKLICVSQYLHEKVSGLPNIKSGIFDLPVINMGVALDQFRPIPKNDARSRLDLGCIDPSEKIVMFVGRLVKIKGVAYLLDAIKILKDKKMLDGLSVIIVGSGPEEKKLKSHSIRLGLSDDIFYAGQRLPDEICVWMSAADVIVIPSLDEGLGLVALEAMACGTPVVSTDSGGLKEFIKHGENGLLVKPKDAAGLAEGILALLDDSFLYRKVVENGFKTAQQNSAEIQALQVGKIYDELVLGGCK